MIVILDGSDKVGKSTLAKEITEVLRAEYVHFSKPEGEPYDDHCKFLDQVDVNKNYVVDRFYVSELVYGEIYRGQARLTIDQMVYLEMRLKSFGCLMIHCSTDEETVRRKFIEDQEQSSKVDDVKTILDKFEDKMKLSNLKVIKYDWQRNNKQGIINEVVEASKLSRLTNDEVKIYVGDVKPEFLLLGDTKRNVEKGVFESRSGKFLFRALNSTGFLRDKRVGVSNSDLMTLDFYKKLGSPRVICLGKNSLARTCKKGIPAVQVYHPQWMFRFGGKDSASKYRDYLKQAMQ